MLRNKGSKLFRHDFGRDGFAIVFSEISGDLTTDMDKLSTIWNKSGSGLGLERQGESGNYTKPMCLSTVCIRRFAPGRRSLDVTSFSTARTTPSFTRIPIAVLKGDLAIESHKMN